MGKGLLIISTLTAAVFLFCSGFDLFTSGYTGSSLVPEPSKHVHLQPYQER